MNTVNYHSMTGMLRGAAAVIREHHETLSRLDSVGGDGDHGTTMLRAMAKLEQAVEAAAPGDLKALLYDVGWAILGVDGGATGPLLGMLFMSMAETAEGVEALDPEGLAAAFERGLEGVRAQTKAQPGDKTMMDALVPAVEALRRGVSESAEIVHLLQLAAEAAEEGAKRTKDMAARFGRARNIKEQSIGTQDPGATSMALLFKGFMKGFKDHA